MPVFDYLCSFVFVCWGERKCVPSKDDNAFRPYRRLMSGGSYVALAETI